MFKRSIFLFFAFIVSFSWAQNENFLRTHLEHLSSEYLSGRKSGSMGQKLAAIYLQEQFKETEIQVFEFVNITHGGIIFNATDTLYHKQDFFYKGLYAPTKFALDSSWNWFSLSAQNVLASLKTSDHQKAVFIIDDWDVFLDLMGHEFSASEVLLPTDFDAKQRIFINSEKVKSAHGWQTSLVKSDSWVYTENVLVSLIWKKENKETVVLSAHYDHLGMDSSGVYFGADDNASGVSLLLLIAAWLQESQVVEKLNKNVVLAFFSGEEQGLLGSRHFVNSDGFDLSSISVCVNFDMVGFVNQETPRAFIVAYNDTDTNRIFVSKNTSIELVNEQSFLHEFSSDQQSFAEKNIPSFLVFSGLHSFYHTTHDTSEKINYKAMNNLFLFLQEWLEQHLFLD